MIEQIICNASFFALFPLLFSLYFALKIALKSSTLASGIHIAILCGIFLLIFFLFYGAQDKVSILQMFDAIEYIVSAKNLSSSCNYHIVVADTLRPPRYPFSSCFYFAWPKYWKRHFSGNFSCSSWNNLFLLNSLWNIRLERSNYNNRSNYYFATVCRNESSNSDWYSYYYSNSGSNNNLQIWISKTKSFVAFNDCGWQLNCSLLWHAAIEYCANSTFFLADS